MELYLTKWDNVEACKEFVAVKAVLPSGAVRELLLFEHGEKNHLFYRGINALSSPYLGRVTDTFLKKEVIICDLLIEDLDEFKLFLEANLAIFKDINANQFEEIIREEYGC